MKPSNLLLSTRSLALAGLAAAFLTACGSTSSLQNAQAVMPARKFTSVTVQDMKLATPQVGEKVNAARIYFADHIAIKLKKTGRFASVARNAKPRADMLVIEGVITKYDEGNMAKRAFVGMGFGMAFVEANVEFRDGKGVKVGSIKVDKHSWALGGWIAAIQNAEDFMDEAADKIAQEAVKLAR